MERWSNDVWKQGKLELVPELVGPSYVRHGPEGTRTVTPEEYAKEIAAMRERIPDIAFTRHDQCVNGNMIWTRWSSTGTDSTTGEAGKAAGIQIYRLEDGKLVETWIAMHPLGSTWPELSSSPPAGETQ
jgi:hypothetical protein